MLRRRGSASDLLCRACHEYRVAGVITIRHVANRFFNSAAVRTVLTPDQQKVFDKNLADMRAQMNQPRPQ